MKRIIRAIHDWTKAWLEEHDTCHICQESADSTCVGCEKRICYGHDSNYYSDAELCTACRQEITPEMEAEELREQREFEAEMEAQ